MTTVMTVCRRMISWKPSTPAATVSAATTISAITIVSVPPPQPSRVNTVAVASVARIVRTVSQPTVSSQEMKAGSRLPRTPNAARLSTIVGAEPRLPASATKPHSRNEKTMPMQARDERLGEGDAETERERAVAQPEHGDVGPEPRPEQLPRTAVALLVRDDVDAVALDLEHGLLYRGA